jgi:Protein of unknown function (DUF1064)
MIKVSKLRGSLLRQRMSAAEYTAAVAAVGPEMPAASRKYGNVPKEYGGRIYDSKAEATWARRLDAFQLAGLVARWEAQQPRYDLVRNPETGRMLTYTADFCVQLPGGGRLVLDCKGCDTQASRLRRALVFEKYGDRIITSWRAVLAAVEGRATA